jgi:hypothetical protein
MSTSNFSSKNILVAVETDDWEDWDFNFFKDNLTDELLKIKDSYEVTKWDSDYHAVWAYDIARYSKEYGTRIYKTIHVTINNGYYSGINLDYIIEEGDDCYNFKGTHGLDKEVEKITEKVVKILKQHGTELKVVARFSSGETVYEKA